MYKLLRNLLFMFPPEWVHYASMNTLRFFCSVGVFRSMIRGVFKPRPSVPINVYNIDFPNPVGLGAGFDKNAKYLRELECLGFGFVEIGTVTPLPQAGNEKPRLFRLPKDKALINRMGFNNDGMEKVASRLKKWRSKQADKKNTGQRLIIGGNIGKNKSTANEDAWKDYAACFKALHPYVDYFVVNVSSPNTPGLRELQEKDSLRKILLHLMMINNGKAFAKPVLLKIAPDLSPGQITDVIELALEIRLDGLVVSNTSTDRSGLVTPDKTLAAIGVGGLSGLPLRTKNTDILRFIMPKIRGIVPVIASGGIFTAADAKEKLNAGASLVQVWTGFIYEGPAIVKRICKSL